MIFAIKLHFTLIEYGIDIQAGVVEYLFIQRRKISARSSFNFASPDSSGAHSAKIRYISVNRDMVKGHVLTEL